MLKDAFVLIGTSSILFILKFYFVIRIGFIKKVKYGFKM